MSTLAPGEPGDVEIYPRNYSLDQQVGFILRKAMQRHAAIFADRMGADLTMTQWAALAKIYETGPCSQNQLGRETAMDAATIKGVVDRLARRHFVASRSDSGDARRRILSLTPAGRELVERSTPQATDITRATLDGLTEGERIMLIELLQKIC